MKSFNFRLILYNFFQKCWSHLIQKRNIIEMRKFINQLIHYGFGRDIVIHVLFIRFLKCEISCYFFYDFKQVFILKLFISYSIHFFFLKDLKLFKLQALRNLNLFLLVIIKNSDRVIISKTWTSKVLENQNKQFLDQIAGVRRC